MKKAKNGAPQALHSLEGDNIPKPVRRKRGGLRLKAKHHRRLKKVLAASSACAILVGGTLGVNALYFNDAVPNTVDEGFATVMFQLPTDGSTPDMHSALENIGYMNTRFKGQSVWYSEMDGNVNTMLSQRVSTWKQYSDSVLIQTDITTSSLINSARQFCWVGDRVIWREAAGGPATYNGIDTAWREGEPYGNMTVEEFKKTRGLPGTEFSVYVINEDTLLGATDVVNNGDGTYTQTYYLDPATDKAPAYYVNQMMTTGGLTSLPTFEYITVSYTFDATWQVLSSYIDEAYTATKGLNAKCTANYLTTYEYGTDKAHSDAYEQYYKAYADKPATGAPAGGVLTAADCLAEAFAPVLQQPVTFDVALEVDGRKLQGLVYVDAADTSALALRAQFGAVYIAYADGKVYAQLGENKLSLDPAALTGLIAGDGLDTDALLQQLGSGSMEQSGDGSSAVLTSTLSLMGLELPVRFAFTVSDAGIALESVSTELSVAGMNIGAALSYSQNTLPARDMTGSADLTPLVENAAELFTGDALRVDLAYALQAGNTPVSLDGTVALDFATLGVKGSLDAVLGTGTDAVKKTLTFAYTAVEGEGGADHMVYLAVDGVKLKLNAGDAVALIMQLMGGSTTGTQELSLGGVLEGLFSLNLASVIRLADGSAVLAGGELLAALGVDFALGNITIAANDGGISLSVLGIEAQLSSEQAFTVNADDYADYADVMPLLKGAAELFTGDALRVDLAYALKAGNTPVSLDGTVALDFATLGVKGSLDAVLGTGTDAVKKTLTFAYTAVEGEGGADHMVYLAVDGVKLKLNAGDAVALIMQLMGSSATGTQELSLGGVLEGLFSLDLASVIRLADGSAVLAGGELLAALGVDFALGDITIAANDGGISLSVLGIEAQLSSEQAFTVNADDYADYADVTPLLKTVGTIVQEERIALTGTLALRYRDMALTLVIERGVLSWKGGLSLSCDLAVIVNGTRQNIRVEADTSRVRIRYGSVGVDLVYDELPSVADAFEEVYARITAVLSRSLAGAELPAVEDLSAQMGAGGAVTELLSGLDLPSLIGGIVLGGATQKAGSLATLSYGALSAEVLAGENGLTIAVSQVSFGDVTLSGELNAACVQETVPGMQTEGLMTAGDLCELLDYIGAAVGTLASSDVSISFAGSTVGVQSAQGEKVFDISGELLYHSGEESGTLPVFVDTEQGTLTLNADAWLYVRLTLDEIAASGTDLYFEFWMVDAHGNNELDFFVTLSKFDESDPAYDPLRFAVSASDVLTILSSGVTLAQDALTGFLAGMGVDADTSAALFKVLDTFLISKWLTSTEQSQLSALGSMLMATLGIDDAIEGMLGGVADAVGDAVNDVSGDITLSDAGCYLTSLGITRGEDGTVSFKVALNSDLVYGGSGMEPLTVVLVKSEGAQGSLLAGISLDNIYGNGNSENTCVDFAFGYGALTLAQDANGITLSRADGTQAASLLFNTYQSYTFEGVDDLIKSLAASATHEENGSYALNNNFFISGEATVSVLDIFKVTVRVDGISISIDETGALAINAKIGYDSVVGIINGKSDIELTIADGMVYMKRTQYEYWRVLGFSSYDTPVVVYRVMPMQNFMADIMGQLAFILNLSDGIAEKMTASDGGTAEETVSNDYGTILSSFLTSYLYTAGTDGGSWALNLNGGNLTDGVLGDIKVTLGSQTYNGRQNILRTLGVTTKLVGFVDVSATLCFRNPCNEWEEGYSDVTLDLTQELAEIAPAVEAFDWASQAQNFYLVPAKTTVYYTVDGESAGAQDVWYSGDFLLTALDYPELSGYEARKGYTLAWQPFTFAPGGTVQAVYAPNLYDVTIVAPVNVGGDWQETEEGYSYTTQMYYGETLTLTWGDSSHVFTVDVQNNVFDLGAAVGEDNVLWNEIKADILTGGSSVVVPPTPDSVVYTSSLLDFSLDDGATYVSTSSAAFDAQYTLATPTAAGYTFLGWFVKNADGGLEQVTALSYQGGNVTTTVSALWISKLTAGEIVTSTSGSWFNYNHTIGINVTGGHLVGEYAQSFDASAAVDMTVKWNTVKYDVNYDNFFPISQTESGWSTGEATSTSPVADPTVSATFSVNVLLNGQSVGSVSLSLSKQCKP